MSDASVHAALRSDESLVVIEAPAGCGKTHQAADYACEMATNGIGKLLILTHTHAACSVFSERTHHASSHVEIRTIDSLIGQVASVYHKGLELPADVAGWARRNENGYAHVAIRVATLLERHAMVAASLARRYPIVVCDEHQDCSGDQHSIGKALHRQGARLRVFADPMQRIYRTQMLAGGRPLVDWTDFVQSAGAFEQLETPHRWNSGCTELGAWTLKARETLKAGGHLDLSRDRPRSVQVVIADNQTQRYGDYQLSPGDRRAIDTFERAHESLLIVSHFARTTQHLRAFFGRRIPLWEGHTRPALEGLIEATITHRGNPEYLAGALVKFMGQVGKGFTPSAFGHRLVREAKEGCTRSASGKPAILQAMARHIVDSPDHCGTANALRMLADLRRTSSDFSQVEVDCHTEFWEAIRLSGHADADEALAHITHHRTHSRPKPSLKAISTIHKAKGLECDAVIVMPCDAQTFPDSKEARCLLYVALSRAKNCLLLVLSRSTPSPLIKI